MTFIAPWKKNRRRPQDDETELQGDQILSAMAADHVPAIPVQRGHEEKAKESLDSIYALETIDIGTVKPLLKKGPAKRERPIPASDPQLTLPLPARLSDPTALAVASWIEQRGGIATRHEIEERLERVQCPADSIPECLIALEDHLFAVDADSEKLFHMVISRAKTYFYQPRLHYPMPALVYWLLCEFAKEWVAMPPEFIEKCLSSSCCFTRFKTNDHQLSVKLTP